MSSPETAIAPLADPLVLSVRIAGVPLRVLTNDEDVAAALRRYYAPWVVSDDVAPVTTINLSQGPAPAAEGFVDVGRGDGKKVKEAVRDLAGGRLILKRTTGVVMGLWPGRATAAGDLRSNLNQAINLVNACYAKALLDRGYVLFHAAGVVREGRCAVLAGVPGAGKSTASLHLVEAGFHFLSNDRVLARRDGDGVEALGYPKQPRVNPGTLLGHPRLAGLLPSAERAALAAMDPRALWWLERKRDVDLDALYGAGTVELRARMRAVVLLRWQLDGEGLVVRRLPAVEALTRLDVFAKDLGMFDLDRPALAPRTRWSADRYAEILERVVVVEINGRPDFPSLVPVVGDLLAQ